MNIFKRIFLAAETGFKELFSPAGEAQLIAIGEKIDSILPQALDVVVAINKMAPTRTEAQLIGLANKYLLHVTPAVLADPVQVESLLENSAVKELQSLTKNELPNSILRTAIGFAVNMFKTHQNTGAVAAQPAATPIPVNPPTPTPAAAAQTAAAATVQPTADAQSVPPELATVETPTGDAGNQNAGEVPQIQ